MTITEGQAHSTIQMPFFFKSIFSLNYYIFDMLKIDAKIKMNGCAVVIIHLKWCI